MASGGRPQGDALSVLVIDTDKDWQGREIRQLGGLSAGAQHGDMFFRGALVMARLPAEYGVGMNVLHLKSLGGGLYAPEWKDIQEWVAYITAGLNRLCFPPLLGIPAMSVAASLGEDHSGGAQMSLAGLSPQQPGLLCTPAEDHSGGGFSSTLTRSPAMPGATRRWNLIWERYQSGDDSQVAVYGANWEAMTFTPVLNHNVTSFLLKGRRLGSPGTITVSLRNCSGALPSGADVAAGSYDGNSLPDGRDIWMLITFASQALSSGTKYAMVCRAPGGDLNNYFAWRADVTAPTYAAGARCYSSDGGASWNEDAAKDYLFEEGQYG